MTNFGKNIIALLLTLLLISFCYKNNLGYNWVYNGLLKGNFEVIQKYKNLTVDQRTEMKLGYNYAYLRYVRKLTPDSAVILMPGSDAITLKEGPSEITQSLFVKLWVTRFLYPRKIIYDFETDNEFYNRITHVAIINYWGYDKLSYQVDRKVKDAVLPVRLQ